MPRKKTIHEGDAQLPNGGIANPELYAQLCEPHDSVDAVRKAFAAFGADLRKIRIKHRIPDTTCVFMANVLDENGDVMPYASITHNGAVERQAPMLAWALGKVEALDHARLDELRRNARDTGPSPVEVTP